MKPTVILAHGAYAEASSWNGIIGPLRASHVVGMSHPAETSEIIREAAGARALAGA